MTEMRRVPTRQSTNDVRARGLRPQLEGLEGRILLYSAIGQWTYSSRITYSFMPEGTSIAGTPSVLFQTMNAVAPTGTWENAIEQAATPWETNANLNLALVSDSGDAFGVNGDQQDDPRFGDIRIGAMPLSAGLLAETFLPPPTNGGTVAGDIFFNSTAQWAVGGVGVDLETVALHEFGHAVGLGDQSIDPFSVMYYEYDGPKTALDLDDIAGIQSLYGAPQYDSFNTGLLHNSTPLTATNITPYISNGQIALSGLDNTTAIDAEYYAVTVPSSNSGQMVVTLQSSNLSSFAPGAVYRELVAVDHRVDDSTDDVRGDGDGDCAGDGRPEVLHQGGVGGDVRPGRRVRAGGELHQQPSVADRAAEHDGPAAAERRWRQRADRGPPCGKYDDRRFAVGVGAAIRHDGCPLRLGRHDGRPLGVGWLDRASNRLGFGWVVRLDRRRPRADHRRGHARAAALARTGAPGDRGRALSAWGRSPDSTTGFFATNLLVGTS